MFFLHLNLLILSFLILSYCFKNMNILVFQYKTKKKRALRDNNNAHTHTMPHIGGKSRGNVVFSDSWNKVWEA